MEKKKVVVDQEDPVHIVSKKPPTPTKTSHENLMQDFLEFKKQIHSPVKLRQPKSPELESNSQNFSLNLKKHMQKFKRKLVTKVSSNLVKSLRAKLKEKDLLKMKIKENFDNLQSKGFKQKLEKYLGTI